MQLGHPPGVICPFRQAAPQDFVLYDLTGVHEINVDFCGCCTLETPAGEAHDPHREQLLRVCWWPTTVKALNTCATFSVLRHFQALNCLGKVSAYDFLRGLEICTNHDGLDNPPVRGAIRYRLHSEADDWRCWQNRRKPFMTIVREWREVKRVKRRKWGNRKGGVKAIPLGGLGDLCRTCPQPGYNLVEGWKDAPPFYR